MKTETIRLPKLRPDIKRRWIEALRSGEYEQGQGTLRTRDFDEVKEEEDGLIHHIYTDHDSYCCLGVLCDVVKDDPKIQGYWSDEDGFVVGDDCEADVPPIGLTQRIATQMPDEDLSDPWDDIIVRNDGNESKGIEPHTFEELIPIIEEYC